MKPFKPPSLVRPGNSLQSKQPPLKKRRITEESGDDKVATVNAAVDVLKKPKPLKSFQTPVREPLEVVKNSSTSSQPAASGTGYEAYFNVLWRKFTTKKNKTWDGDGILSVTGGYATLQDLSGKSLGRIPCRGPLLIGSELSIGNKEIEVDSSVSKADFIAGRPFLGTVKEQPAPVSLKDDNEGVRVTNEAQAKHKKIVAAQEKAPPRPQLAASKGTNSAFRAPLLNNNVQAPQRDAKVPVPRHDPKVEGALVMKKPKSAPKGRQIVDVVVDPLLTKNLRPHQREGVAFLYECVMGMKDYEGEGAILADEMGLGKTLQTIALLWTLMKQNPVYEDGPVIKKALIVCPVSLINNWRKEFRKWLGNERIGVFVESNHNRLTDFTKGRAYSVMIIGYERLRTAQAELQKGIGIDIVIADEGHRLKTAQNKSAAAIKTLSTDRRIILSGTPIQNDLAEFHTMVDFVNPNLLNKYNTFKREFEVPILKSQQPGASAKDIEKGEGRSEELAGITGMFILRRTAEILSSFLPPKTEYVVFCRPTAAQVGVYKAIIGSPIFAAALGSNSAVLELINILKKVCNSPNLLLQKNDKGEEKTKAEVLAAIPPSLLRSAGASGKLQVLDSLLHRIRTTSQEKVVLVSNYTSTLDILANLLNALDYSHLRLDGTTPPKKRQDLVDRFNRDPPSSSFVFLLSAKAGGIGLNLIGASRLILYDIDWNPAVDLQAMARIHRDGQKRPCYIYRFLTQGALDEKIFQRQVSKTGLADSIVDGKSAASGFTRDELRDLFTLDESTDCQTHKLLGCKCGGDGTVQSEPGTEASTPRNDLASLDTNEEDVEVLHLDGDSDDEPLRPRKKKYDFKSSADYDWEVQEAEIQRESKECKDSSGKAKMLSLMQYTHFDAVNVPPVPAREGDSDDEAPAFDPLEASIEDKALRNVLREDKRVGFVFTKTSG